MATERDRDLNKHSPVQQVESENRDPITGAPGSHPLGVGVGTAGGGAAGAAIGAVAGPIGSVIGAAIGGIAGGLLGKGVAEGVNPTDEHAFWEKEFKARPYYQEGYEYTAYGPAYQYGWETYGRYEGRRFEDIENDLRRDWESNRGERDLSWDQARHATRDAWERLKSRKV